MQTIKLFKFLPEYSKTLIFIHGGAWRDPNNTYLDFANLVGYLDMADTNMVGINYRLSPQIKHPYHLVDVAAALQKILSLTGHSKVLLVGHSVGATLLLQLLNYREIIALGSVSGAEIELPKLELDIDTIFFVDGIFDIVDLIAEYGAPYKLFVDVAFDSETHYVEASQMTWTKAGFRFDQDFRAVVVQSKQDELLSERQSERFVSFLEGKNVPVEYLAGNWGKHEEVYRRAELADIIKARI